MSLVTKNQRYNREMSFLRAFFFVLLLFPCSSCSSSVLDVHASPIRLRQMVEVQWRLSRRAIEDDSASAELVRLSREFLALTGDAGTAESISGHPLNVLYLYDFWRKSAPSLRDELTSREELSSFLASLPGEREVRAAALSVVRMQRVYNISTVELVEGRVEGKSAARYCVHLFAGGNKWTRTPLDISIHLGN